MKNDIKPAGVPGLFSKSELILFLVIAVLGAVYVRYTWMRIENEQFENALHIGRSIKALLPKDNLKALQAKPDDIYKPQYQVIKKELKAIIQINSKARFAYLFTERNGKILIFADSEPEDSKDYSPPGQEYTEANKAYNQCFSEGKEMVTNRIADRWGTWISLLIPIMDEDTGNIIAGFGMDYNARSWSKLLILQVIQSSALIVLLLLVLYISIRISGKHKSLKIEIAERRKAEQSLVESEGQKAAILKAIPDLLFVFNQNGDYLDVYSENDSKLILPREALVGKNISDLFPSHIAKQAIEAFRKSFESKELVQFFYSVITSNGTESYEARIVPAPDNKVLAIVRDITERKLAEEAIREALVKAEAGDRLKTAFMNNISHEVRTPLNSILGFSSLIIQPETTGNERELYFAHIEASGDRLLNTITNYMDISLLASGNVEATKETFVLDLFFKTLHSKYQPFCMAKNIGLRLEIPTRTERIQLFSDSKLLRKIFSHLLDNAVKFTSKGGITFGFQSKEGVLKFFVKDTGAGISENAQQWIFESFRQEELLITRGFEGSGLGLTIAQGLVMLLGGEIRVESAKGAGSLFSFTLPCQETVYETEIAGAAK